MYFDPHLVFCFCICLVYFQNSIKVTLMLCLYRWYVCFECRTLVRKCSFLKAHVFCIQWSVAKIQYLSKSPVLKECIKKTYSDNFNIQNVNKLVNINKQMFNKFFSKIFYHEKNFTNSSKCFFFFRSSTGSCFRIVKIIF